MEINMYSPTHHFQFNNSSSRTMTSWKKRHQKLVHITEKHDQQAFCPPKFKAILILHSFQYYFLKINMSFHLFIFF